MDLGYDENSNKKSIALTMNSSEFPQNVTEAFQELQHTTKKIFQPHWDPIS